MLLRMLYILPWHWVSLGYSYFVSMELCFVSKTFYHVYTGLFLFIDDERVAGI